MKQLVYREYEDSWLYISFLSMGISFVIFICGCVLISFEYFVLGILFALFGWFLFSFSTKYNKSKIELVISKNSEHRIFLNEDGKLNSRTISRIRTYELDKLVLALLIFIVVLLLEIFAKELISVKESRIRLLIKHLDEVYQMRQQ